MKLLVSGGGGDGSSSGEEESHWDWDGWADWARVLGALRAWEEELEMAWASEAAAKEMLTELVSVRRGN